MEADETGTIARLGGHPHQLTDPAIARHHGRIVKLMGDGALVAFDSLDLKDVLGQIRPILLISMTGGSLGSCLL
jgi:class 3 adenylate cyclase